MKILLDENLDHRLRHGLGEHEVFTVSYLGWDGLKNGRLLEAAQASGFAILITGDQSLPYEQDIAGQPLAVIALSSVEWRILKDHLPKIVGAIEIAVPGSFQAVDCGKFTRKKSSNP